MKRLKCIMTSMNANTTTYREMYDGSMIVSDPANPWILPYEDNNATYYHNDDIGFEISETHKLAKDKPTVLITIPCSVLGIDEPNKEHKEAAADFCLRQFTKYIDEMNALIYNRSRPANENGKYYICSPGGEIVKRNSAFFAVRHQKDYRNGSGVKVYLLDDGVERLPRLNLCIMIQVQLPRGHMKKAMTMLCRDLPYAVDHFIMEFDHAGLAETTALADRQSAIRAWLKDSDYCAFVANGSILPRAKAEKGQSRTDLPLSSAVPFVSTPEDEIEVCGVRGMGIRKGVTVITGGGYSGKSTLLDAISAGIYNHVLGDGRELCITDDSAMTISAEDGRSVKHVNISPFIKWLPGGDTADFSTDHASGSTSQAANIMEAVDSGARLLLIDEDRSATNFMIRDAKMKELIKKEPITPFTDRVNELHTRRGVSTILVIGGSGEYLAVADKIYMMEDYLIHDVSGRAKDISSGVDITLPDPTDWSQSRVLYSDGFTSYPGGIGTEKLEVLDMGFILIGDEKIDVRGIHDIITPGQLYSLGFMLRYLEATNKDSRIDIDRRIDELYAKIDGEGADVVFSAFFTTCERFLDVPRKQELKAVVNRMRMINLIKSGER